MCGGHNSRCVSVDAEGEPLTYKRLFSDNRCSDSPVVSLTKGRYGSLESVGIRLTVSGRIPPSRFIQIVLLAIVTDSSRPSFVVGDGVDGISVLEGFIRIM